MAAFRSDDTVAPCTLCYSSSNGICINNNTVCQCFSGFIGPSCKDRVTTLVTRLAESPTNVAAVIAGVLAGALLATVISLIIFCIWKRRMKQKANSFSPSSSVPPKTSSIPIVAPALYNISSFSRRSSSVTSAPTLTYHLYEELL